MFSFIFSSQTFLFKPNQIPPILNNQTTVQGIQSMMNQNLSSMPQQTNSIQGGFGQDIDLRSAIDPRLTGRQQHMSAGSLDHDMRMNQMPIGINYEQRQSGIQQRQFPSDPRQRGANDPRDPRQKTQQQQPQQNSLAAQLHRGISNDATDQEKAALIMQVLKLTDEQISCLPPEQRASILVLKEQIAKSAHLK